MPFLKLAPLFSPHGLQVHLQLRLRSFAHPYFGRTQLLELLLRPPLDVMHTLFPRLALSVVQRLELAILGLEPRFLLAQQHQQSLFVAALSGDNLLLGPLRILCGRLHNKALLLSLYLAQSLIQLPDFLRVQVGLPLSVLLPRRLYGSACRRLAYTRAPLSRHELICGNLELRF